MARLFLLGLLLAAGCANIVECGKAASPLMRNIWGYLLKYYPAYGIAMRQKLKKSGKLGVRPQKE
jgi:hypothetical protein